MSDEMVRVIPMVVFVVGFWAYVATCISRIAEKVGTSGRWMAWVPILNLVLICRIGGQSGWWVLLCLIPYIGMVAPLLFLLQLPKALGQKGPVRFLMAVPLVNLFYLGYLAFRQERGSDVPNYLGYSVTENVPAKSKWPLIVLAIVVAIGISGLVFVFVLTSAEAHNRFGLALAGRGQVDEAIIHYCKALKIKPDYAEAYDNLGNALASRGNVDEAIACYQKALKIKPDYAEAHTNFGNALARRGQIDEAIAHYRRALEIKPDYAEAAHDLQTASMIQSVAPEPWITKPPESWPQIVLTNEASFTRHTPLRGASSFLIRTRNGCVLALTAKHLLGKDGGVWPKVSLSEFDSVLRTWKMFPRTVPQSSVEIEALGFNDGLDFENCDWLILKLKHPAEVLPAQPLHIRRDPVKIGERVYLIGCPYIECDCKQNVYRAKVTAREFPDRFFYELDPPAELNGFSGAPIIDEKGYVVGEMTVYSRSKVDGKKSLEGGGEDAATIYSAVESPAQSAPAPGKIKTQSARPIPEQNSAIGKRGREQSDSQPQQDSPSLKTELQYETERQPFSEIGKLGGRIEFDEKVQGRPVIRIDFAFTKVTDAGLERLKGLTQLQTLDLDYTDVTDAGLEHLKGLTQLKTLFLTNTQVTDAGLEHLKGLTQLHKLYLRNCIKVTDVGVESLRKALPALKVEGFNQKAPVSRIEKPRGETKVGDTQKAVSEIRKHGGPNRDNATSQPTKNAGDGSETASLSKRCPSARRLAIGGATPSWSPDGRQMAFSQMPFGVAVGIINLETMAISSQLAPGKDAVWCRSNQKLVAFVRGGNARHEEIWLADPSGKSPRKIADGGWPTWAGDGKSLYFHSRSKMKIMKIGIDPPGEPVPVCDMPYSFYPPITADGKRTAYRNQDELVVYDIETQKPLRKRQLTGWFGLVANWSPDGKLLGYGSYGVNNSVGLWIMNVDTGQVIQVVEGPCTAPAWSPDGSKLAFDRRIGAASDVWMVDTKDLDKFWITK